MLKKKKYKGNGQTLRVNLKICRTILRRCFQRTGRYSPLAYFELIKTEIYIVMNTDLKLKMYLSCIKFFLVNCLSLHKAIIVFGAFVFLGIVMYVQTFRVSAEEHAVKSQVENAAEKETALAREASSFADFFREQSKVAFKGVILGNVISITDEYIYVKPREKGLGRMYIYTDKQTLYSEMSNGKRKKAKKEQLLEGLRVAARVIMKEGIILADEVFMVEGEFDSLSRYRKRVYKAVPKKEGEGGAKAKEGGHGESKPAAKKSGGH